MKRLSFVIPVYNLEQYISATLDSCLRQDISLDEYEIICINDGSSDKSEEIISEYALKHPQIRLCSQENAGVSAARNKGVELARGKYIWFVDGDDIISDNCLKYILDIVEENNIDILRIGIQNAPNLDAFQAELKDDCCVSKKNENRLLFMTARGGTGGGVCRQVFKTELIRDNALRFNQRMKYSEDVLFGFQALIKSNRLAKTDNVLYHYYQRPGSAMHSPNYIKHIESMYLLAAEYIKIADEEKEWREVALSKKNFAVKALLFSLVLNGDVKLAREWIATLRKDGLYPFPFLRESLRGNATAKQAAINYLSFLFPWKWYFMTCVRLMALNNKSKRKK